MKKLQDLPASNHKSRPIKLPAPANLLHFDITRQQFFRMLQSTEFQASLEKLNTLQFPVCFMPSNNTGKDAS